MPIQLVTNPNIFPLNSVADVDVFDPVIGATTASAVSIGNGIFLTATHVITNGTTTNPTGLTVPSGLFVNLTLLYPESLITRILS